MTAKELFMKRVLSVSCIIILICASVSSCGKKGGDMMDDVSDMVSDMTDGGEKYTLRLGVHQNHDASEGKAKFSSTYVAVVCDKKGNIVDCVFDATDDTVSIEGGKVTVGGDYRSKNEQGNDYSMRSASGIGKEWYEQAEHFAKFIVGYNIDDAEDIDGGEAELMAGCTIDINGFKEALEEAADNEKEAVTFECTEAPSAALAIVSTDEGSKDATAEKDGIAALTSTYAAVAKKDDKIAAANIEVTESKVYFDESGLVSQVEHGDGKREEGDSYGMKASSAIGLEWYQQVRNFENYIVGMTPDEVTKLDMSEGYATDTDLKAGCTIKINDFVKAIAKTA